MQKFHSSSKPQGFLSIKGSQASQKDDESTIIPGMGDPNYNPHDIRVTASYGAPL